MEEAFQQSRNCNDELIVKLIGKLTLEFEDTFKDFSTQIKLKETLEQAFYGYDVVTKCTDLICSDIEEKMQVYIAVHSSPATTIQSYISLSNESLRSDYNKAML